MVTEHSDILFGEYSAFFPKRSIKAPSGIVTIPDGFVLAIDDKRWYIVEVELSSHPLYDHIIVQTSKFNSAIRNLTTRRPLIDVFYNTIENDIRMKRWFEGKGITKELYKFLSDLIINKDPDIVILIDQKTKELDEVCKTLPFQTTVLEFQTYCQEGAGTGVHIHHFETLRNYKEEQKGQIKRKGLLRQNCPKGVRA